MKINLIKYDFIRISVVSPELSVANVEANTDRIIDAVKIGKSEGSSLFLFPELGLSSYSCGDLFYQVALHKSIGKSLLRLKRFSGEQQVTMVVGCPIQNDGKLFNCAAFISNGEIKGIVPKTFIPNNDEYYEERWFSGDHDRTADFVVIDKQDVPFGADLIFHAANFPLLQIGIEICEDLWSVVPPSSDLALSGANVILNLSASSEYLGKSTYRRNLVVSQSARCQAAYLYASAGAGESSTDFIMSGHSIIAENGILMKESEKFSFETQIITADIDLGKLNSDRLKNSSFAIGKSTRDFRVIPFEYTDSSTEKLLRPNPRQPFVPEDENIRAAVCEEILEIQSTALAKRLKHIGSESVVLGLSGGLDSTLAYLVCLKTFEKIGLPPSQIIAVSMPGFGTSSRTKNNAQSLAEASGATFMEIDIAKSVNLHFADIGHKADNHDVVFENSQARMRTMILMNLANKHKGIVIGTGDLSEAALGWSTYNGDHMSMYSVNSGVPKTLVKFIIEWVASTQKSNSTSDILLSILDTPISPELLPLDENQNITQETEKIVGPYVLNDFFLYHFVRYNYSPKKIAILAKYAFKDEFTLKEITSRLKYFIERFFQNQYKRSCVPDGIKIGSVALSPRGDWRMPSDADSDLWLKELSEINEDNL